MKLRFSALPTIILRAGAALTLLVTAFAPPRACAQNAADGYAPQIAGRINTIVVQPDGKALIGGEMNQADCHRVCRLLADGRVDTSFTASGIDGNVEAIAVQADGKVLIGGYFSSVGGAPRMRLARLNASGSLDTGFVGPVLTGAGGTAVKDFSVQADGKVMVAGSFDTVGGTARKGVARLNSNGSLDASFIDPALNGGVSSLLRQSDGTLLLGGSFTSVGGQTGHSIVRLDANGNIDPTYSAPAFSIGADVGIWKLAVQADGKVLVGGSFTHVAGQPHARLVRLDANGGLDDSFFDPLIDSMVTSLLVQPDGAILIGGFFNSVGGQPRGHVARITADGVIDLSFRDPAFNNWVGALALQPDAKLLVTGDFDQIGGVPHDRLARLNSTGGIDTNFTDTGANGYVYALAAQTDDKLLVGGDFTSLSGYNRHGIARLKTNGAVDTDFLYLDVQGGEVLSLTLQSDGRVLAGGDFTAIGGQPRSHLARFNSSGVLDTSFADPLVSGAVYAVDTLSLDRVLIGGAFNSVGGQSRAHVARLNSDGSPDTLFVDPGVNGAVMSLAELPNSKVLIGGPFTAIQQLTGGHLPRHGLARLNVNGSLDGSFADPQVTGGSGLYDSVMALALLPNGNIVIGGGFDSVGGQSRKGLAILNPDGSVLDKSLDLQLDGMVTSLALQADGKILVSGDFTTIGGHAYKGIARLNPSGSLDTSFVDPNADGAVYAITLQPDGKLLAGGGFTVIGGQPRSRVARLSLAEAATQSLEVVDKTVTWRRGGTAPELSSPPTLSLYLDTYLLAYGSMSRINGTWQYTLSQPIRTGHLLDLTVFGHTAGGAHNASHGEAELLHRIWRNDTLFANGFE